MTYSGEDAFRAGVPQTVLRDSTGRALALAPRALAGHWTAGGTGRAGALGTLQFFIDTAERNASYHELWWHAPGHFGYLRIVRPENAAHGINPAAWLVPKTFTAAEKAEFDFIRKLLGAKAGDPNAATYQVSFAGMPADLAAAMQDPEWMKGAIRRTKELMAQFKLDTAAIVTHGGGQPTTRYDWGTELRPALYKGLLAAPEEIDMGVLTRPVREQWDVPAGMAFYTGGPNLGERKLFTTAERLWSNGESLDGNWRRLEYEDSPGAGEELWAWRGNMKAVPGTRNPATGFGTPVMEAPDGHTDQELTEAAKAAAADVKAAASERAAKYGA